MYTSTTLMAACLLDHRALEAQLLGSVWKGCSQASSHATNEYKHPSVSDGKELPEALTIIAEHLQNTIYQKAGKNASGLCARTREVGALFLAFAFRPHF